MKSILLALADPQAVVEVNQALGSEWETTSAATEADAVAQLNKRSFDALLVDFNFGSPDASELMNQALEKRPDMLRFLVAYEADLALVAAKVPASHQILPKPVDPASLKSRIENGITQADEDEHTTHETASVATAPKIPAVYSKLLKALDSPSVTNKQVGAIIAKDSALTAEILNLTQSTYMGLPRNLTEPVAAVESLGLDTVRAAVMAMKFLAEHSHLKPCYLSLDRIWEHSTNVARMARDLVLFETKDRTLGSQALIAGLLHDLGKVVLVTNFDDLYGRVHSLARKQPVSLWEIEKEMFGANHGEIGACLLGMWNMPNDIVEAAAFHHEPPLGESEGLTPLAAVHIANVLAHEQSPSDDFRAPAIISTPFLNELGLLERLPVWRATCANGAARREKPAGAWVKSALGNGQAANQLSRSTTATRTTLLGFRTWTRPWVYSAVAAAALLMAALWIGTRPGFEQSLPVHARTPDAIPVEMVAEPEPEVARPPTVSQPAPEAALPPPARPAVAPAPAFAAPPKNPRLEFRLSGIIYNVAHPSAIVNGKTVYTGEQVSGATVIKISPSEVTLDVNGLRKTCRLR